MRLTVEWFGIMQCYAIKRFMRLTNMRLTDFVCIYKFFEYIQIIPTSLFVLYHYLFCCRSVNSLQVKLLFLLLSITWHYITFGGQQEG